MAPRPALRAPLKVLSNLQPAQGSEAEKLLKNSEELGARPRWRQPPYESDAAKAAAKAASERASARLASRAKRAQSQAERAKARYAERVQRRSEAPAAAAAAAAAAAGAEGVLTEGSDTTTTKRPPRRSMFADLLPALYEDGAEGGARGGAAESSEVRELSEEELQEQWRQRLLPLGLHVSGQLGKGSLAVVYGGKLEGAARAGAASEESGEGDSVAIKVLLPKVIDKEKVRAEFRTEAKLWGSLDHPNVACVRAALEVGRDTAIVMEVCDCNLLSHLRQRRADGSRVPVDVPSLTLDIARGIAAMHEAGVVHRDIKSPNVLLAYDDDQGRLVAKLCDLSSAAPLADTLPHSGRNPNPVGGGGGGGAGGGAPPAGEPAEEAAKDELAGALKWGADIVLHAVRQLSSSPSSNQWMPVGTLAWMAPEMMSQHYEDEPMVRDPDVQGKCDVYAFACVTFELLTGQVPWPQDKPFGRNEVVQAVVEDGWRPELPLWVSPSLASLLRDCWSASPAVRPPMAKVVARLEALPAWSTDGRVEAASAALAQHAQLMRAFNVAVVAAGGRRLRLVGGNGISGEIADVGAEGVSIGRSGANTLRLTDLSVSRMHAKVKVTPDGFLLVDCGSSNGTSVNWTPVPPEGKLLRPRDIVSVGSVIVKVVQLDEGGDKEGA